MKVITSDQQPEPKTILTLVAQNNEELKYLNTLIQEGQAIASGNSYEVIVFLKAGRSLVDFKVHLSTKLHFQVEQEE
jgi:hypothetical protein